VTSVETTILKNTLRSLSKPFHDLEQIVKFEMKVSGHKFKISEPVLTSACLPATIRWEFSKRIQKLFGFSVFCHGHYRQYFERCGVVDSCIEMILCTIERIYGSGEGFCRDLQMERIVYFPQRVKSPLARVSVSSVVSR
jgi:hypothetical protein